MLFSGHFSTLGLGNGHYDEKNYLAYCYTCVMGLKQKKMRTAKADPAYVSGLIGISA